MESAQCGQCGQVFVYMCVHVCMYLFCNFFDTSFGEQNITTKNQRNYIAFCIEVRIAFSSGTFIVKIPFQGLGISNFWQNSIVRWFLFLVWYFLCWLWVVPAWMNTGLWEMLLKSSSMWVSQLLVHQMELIISSSKKEYNIDLSQKNIHKKNRQSNDRATRLLSVWSWWLAWSTPTISHTSAVARSSIKFLYLCITNKELWPDRKCLIRLPWNPACLKASWGRLWTGAIFLRQLCENLQGELLTFKSF